MKTDGAISYTACPAEGCSKKVTEYGPNLWNCERCGRQYDSCQHRYLLSPQIADASDCCWVNLFNEAAAQIIGVSAESLNTLKSEVRPFLYPRMNLNTPIWSEA